MTSVHSEDEFGTVPKCARFCLFTRKTNLERYQNVHVYTKDEFGTVPKCACLHERRIWNGTKMCMFTQKTNSERYQNVHGFACLHERRIRSRTEICTVPSARLHAAESYNFWHGFDFIRYYTHRANRV